MKRILAVLTLIAATLNAHAQIPGLVEPAPGKHGRDVAPSDESIRQIRIEVLMVRVPEATALTLLPELQDADRIKAAQAKIIELISKNAAELVDWPIVTNKSGQRFVVESIHELRYPVEFSQPQIEIHVPNASPVAVAIPSAPDAVKPDENKHAAPQPVAVIGGVPKTFETRNVGVSLEAEPVISPSGRMIDMQLAPQHVTFLQWNKTTTELLGGNLDHKVVIEMPLFETVKLNTNISILSGQPMLLHFAKLKQPAATVELFILTATIVDVRGRAVPAK